MPLNVPGKISATEDDNVVGNPIFVQVSNGTGAGLNPGTGATDLGKAEDAAHTSGDVGVMALAVRDDAGGSLVSTDGDYSPFSINSSGELRIAGSFTAGAEKVEDAAHSTGDTGNFILAVRNDANAVLTTTTLDYSPIAVADDGAIHIDDGGNSITVDQSTHGNLNANVTLQINDADVSATVPVPISATEAANTELNPIFVHTVNTTTSGNEVHSYDENIVTANTTENHDYTVTGTTFLWKSSIVSSTGPFFFEFSSGPVAGLVSFATAVLNGREGDTQQVVFDPAREVPITSTGTARIARTNRHTGQDNEAYTTIIGNDVA